MVVSDLLGSGRPDEEQRTLRTEPDQVVQELDRVAISPLQVVEDEQQGAARGADCAPGGLEHEGPASGIGHGR
jgi:hypothetical protein